MRGRVQRVKALQLPVRYIVIFQVHDERYYRGAYPVNKRVHELNLSNIKM